MVRCPSANRNTVILELPVTNSSLHKDMCRSLFLLISVLRMRLDYLPPKTVVAVHRVMTSAVTSPQTAIGYYDIHVYVN